MGVAAAERQPTHVDVAVERPGLVVADRAREHPGTEREQNGADGRLEETDDRRGETHAEQEQGEPEDGDGRGVPDAPRRADEARTRGDAARCTGIDERRHCREVVGFEGVTGAQGTSRDGRGDE